MSYRKGKLRPVFGVVAIAAFLMTSMLVASTGAGASEDSPMLTNPELGQELGAVPTAPLNLTPLAGPDYINLTWLAPVSQGNSSIIQYDIYRGVTSGGETLLANVTADTLYYNDTSAVIEQLFYYYVTAVNSNGSSPASNEVSNTATATPLVPNPPQNLVAIGSNSSVSLTWQHPSSPGTSDIFGYDIFRGDSAAMIGAIAIDSTSSGTMTYNDSDVVNNQTYFYEVRAVNWVGSSIASNVAQAMPSETGIAPGAPTDLEVAGHVGYVLLSWVAPVEVGSGVGDYQVFRAASAGGQGTTPLATVSGGSLTYTDESATPSVPYYYAVKASNPYGASAFSNEAIGTAIAETPGTPSAPQNLVATPGPGKVTLTWQAPADDGGSAITGYEVHRGIGASAPALLATTGASNLTYVDNSGTVGTTYSYIVVAVNANGSGAESLVASAASQPGAAVDDNVMLYLGIGLAVVVVIAVIALVMMRRKP